MSLVRTDITDGVALITLDDPDRRNALGGPLGDDLVAAVDAVEADTSVGAVVVTGEGRAFCAGADLSDLGASERDGLLAIYEGFLRVAHCPLPTIAAVNGAAVGAGMNLALACDVRLAARRARFDTRFLQLGLHPGGGHTWMFRRVAGPQAAAAALLFGEILDGAEAERVGLVWRCVDDDELLATAHELAARAAAAPRELVVKVKETLGAMAGVATHDEAVDLELDPQVWSLHQPAFAERLAALQAKISKR
ncbi:enoyl-CoA hydratase [Iamia sp.]|uniref:enoyl-CoA hydratase n=1 Tax=Iamia sp. TaxID=2722710 RepID=UPI002D0C29D0|nr:enoyl-CoA hydratase [Iamia sp.]HXH59476.1 enoyl-CoA hydratase [Iamia sp.]